MIDTNKIHCLTEEKIIKLQCIIDYNNTMGVVDKVEQIFYSLNSSRKSLKCRIIHIFYYKFHPYLIKQVLQKYSSSRIHEYKSNDRSADNESFRLTQRHFTSAYVKHAAIRKNARRKYVMCRKYNRRSETRHECFKLRHNLLDY